ncbi:hypothetical protein KSP39_PZI016207 [Platanthera zijinensis]|uniref:Uncharacterized protein n=1 Tax=Platanthera zijinensis TaxID=2320716 RepID=A0AAP0G0W5_9ASPA
MVAISTKRINLEGDGDLGRYLSTKIPEVCEEDKCESDCVRSCVEVRTHNILRYPIVTGSGFTNYDFDPFTEVKKVNKMLHDESRSIIIIDSCNNYSGECQTAYDIMGGRIWKNDQLLSPHVEKHQCLHIDVVGNVNATGSLAEQLDQNSRGMIIGGDGKKTIPVLFDESSSKSMTAEGCQFNASQLASLLFNSHETSNELLPSKSVCITQYDDTCANMKVDDNNPYTLSGEILSLCNATSPLTNSTKLINSVSEEIMVDTKAIPSLLISHGECRIPENVHVDNSEKNLLELHFDYEEHSSDSTIDIDHATGLEKDRLWEHDEPRHQRERSPARSFSQRNRLEDMDSRIRMKPDEYYEPNYFERFQDEYCGYGRGSKHDGSHDDQRGKNNRYEVLHPEGHLESNDNMSCLHYDDDISDRNLRQLHQGFNRGKVQGHLIKALILKMLIHLEESKEEWALLEVVEIQNPTRT